MARMPDIYAEVERDRTQPQETVMTPEDQPRHAIPASPVRQLHDIATQLNANPLIAAIDAHPGMGQNLTAQDVDTVMRVIASIEAARIEVPTRYEQATANRAATQAGS